MDLSKLPKLSKTSEVQPIPETSDPLPPQSAPPSTPPPTATIVYALPAASIGLAEAWISIALGVLIFFIFPDTLRYIHSPANFEQSASLTDEHGNTISYRQSAFFWTDLGVSVFALALILEGIALALIRKPGPLWIAFVVTVAAAVFNVAVIAGTRAHIDFPIFCGIGVVILGYMALTQWRLISALKSVSK